MGKTQSHYDRVAALFFLAVGGGFAGYACTIEIGAWNEPGPGFLPLLAGLTLVLMSSALLLASLGRNDPPKASFFPKTDSWKRVLATFLALVAYNLAFEFLGFTATTFLFVGFLVKFIFPQSWTRSLVTAAATAVLARILFVDLLQTQLPKGFLGI